MSRSIIQLGFIPNAEAVTLQFGDRLERMNRSEKIILMLILGRAIPPQMEPTSIKQVKQLEDLGFSTSQAVKDFALTLNTLNITQKHTLFLTLSTYLAEQMQWDELESDRPV